MSEYVTLVQNRNIDFEVRVDGVFLKGSELDFTVEKTWDGSLRIDVTLDNLEEEKVEELLVGFLEEKGYVIVKE